MGWCATTSKCLPGCVYLNKTSKLFPYHAVELYIALLMSYLSDMMNLEQIYMMKKASPHGTETPAQHNYTLQCFYFSCTL